MQRVVTLALVVGLAIVWTNSAQAHLCNDVFAQAKDNLAVKVDIRDGQLRIGKQASFRVYLLNTMDRDIANIDLNVASAHFDVEIKPASSWESYPALKTVVHGGRKEYFEVELTRKPAIPDGRYRIQLRLISGENADMIFKTLDMTKAARVFQVPTAPADMMTVDGTAGEKEWKKSVLCTGFHSYKQKGNYWVNRPARERTRVRLTCDKENIYCLMSFQSDAEDKDVAAMFFATGVDAKPVDLTLDRVTGKLAGALMKVKGAQAIVVKTGDDGMTVELAIPRALLKLDKARTLYANFTRSITRNENTIVTYWRGNPNSITLPVVYGQFRLPE